jgi:hypothetical protein
MRSTTNVVSGRNFRIFISMPEASPKPASRCSAARLSAKTLDNDARP